MSPRVSLVVAFVALAALSLVNAKALGKQEPQIGKWDAHETGQYADGFARDYMMPLAAAAYSDDPQTCVGRRYTNTTVSLHVKGMCEASEQVEHCSGFTAVSHSDRAIILAFRGTEKFIQFISEVEHVIFRKMKPSPIGGRAAMYFTDVFEHLWARGIGLDMRQLVAQYPSYEIWVTGHSLGGAVASVAGATILTELGVEKERIKIVTYGQPRTGDREYAAAYDEKLPRTYRVVHAHDIVPHLPPRGFERFEHHGAEVWYPNAMAPTDRFVVCKDRESRKCSDGQFDADLNDHAIYFSQWVSKWGQAGCSV